jgi:hypothetical protein
MSLTRVRWRLSLTLLCLFASTFQSSLALAHVHSNAGGEAYVAGVAHSSALTSARQPEQSPSPSGAARESDACPLCQILIAGGGLPLAPFQVPVRPVVAAEHAPLEQVPACFIAAVSYDWHSRGPPRI